MLSPSHEASYKVFSNQTAESPTSDFDDFQHERCHKVNEPIRHKCSTTQSASTLHNSVKNYFSYTEFYNDQEWAIRRVLVHKRTLLVAPTGQGKSLRYALLAALMDWICVVVSPLTNARPALAAATQDPSSYALGVYDYCKDGSDHRQYHGRPVQGIVCIPQVSC